MTYKGYQDKEKRKGYLKGYMREYRRRKLIEQYRRRELTEEKIDNQLLRKELGVAIRLFHNAHLITRDPSLTDREKVFQIKNIPVPFSIIRYLNICEKLKQEEMKKVE